MKTKCTNANGNRYLTIRTDRISMDVLLVRGVSTSESLRHTAKEWQEKAAKLLRDAALLEEAATLEEKAS